MLHRVGKFSIRRARPRSLCAPLLRRGLFYSESLDDRTTAALARSKVNDDEISALLSEWLAKAPRTDTALLSTQALYNHWIACIDRPKETTPFKIMMKLYQQEADSQNGAKILDDWGRLLEGHLDLAPTLEAFHMLIQSYTPSELEDALDILKFLEQSYLQGNFSLHPQIATYAMVIRLVHQTELPNEKMPYLLDKLQESFEEEPRLTEDSAFHMIQGYSYALIWAKCYHPDKLDQWWEAFHANLNLTRNSPAISLALSYDEEQTRTYLSKAFLNIFSHWSSHETRSATKEEATLEILSFLESLEEPNLPSNTLYAEAIKLWAASHQANASKICQELLHKLEAQYLDTYQLPFAAYSDVICLWASQNEADKAELLLMHVMKLIEAGKIFGKLSKNLTITWNNVLNSHFYCNNNERVWELWNKMKSAPDVDMNSASYGAVLKALNRCKQAIRRCNKVWEAIEQDSSVKVTGSHYGSTISVYAKAPGKQAATEAQRWLEELEEVYRESGFKPELRPELAHYSAVLDAWSRSKDLDAVKNSKDIFDRLSRHHTPDATAYTSLLAVLANQRTASAAEEAEMLLNEFVRVSHDEGKHRPNIFCYSVVISAWSKSGSPNAPDRAQAILERAEKEYRETGDEQLKPDTVCYGSLLSAWASSRRKEGGERATALLEKIKNIDESCLSTVLFTNAIVAHWRSKKRDAGEKAEELLHAMKRRTLAGDLKCKPDTIAYTSVIQAFATSSDPRKPRKAWALLKEMCAGYLEGDLDIKPNVITFTAVLNACAFVRGSEQDRKDSVRVALMVLKEFNDNGYDQPSSIMYRTLFNVFARQVSDQQERAKFIAATFQRCCEAGQVDNSIIEFLQEHFPSLHAKLPRNRDGQIKIAPEWQMNTR